ncbi:MAG: hypothetical protein ACTHNW_00765, partial [Mucilaginibacter sp.]
EFASVRFAFLRPFLLGLQRYEPFLILQIFIFLFFQICSFAVSSIPARLFSLYRFFVCGLQRCDFFLSLSSVIFTFFRFIFSAPFFQITTALFPKRGTNIESFCVPAKKFFIKAASSFITT